MSHLVQLPAGTRGFDLNMTLTSALARKFHDSGYCFALRYIPRVLPKSIDLTAREIEVIQAAELGVMPVQHVLSETAWQPNGGLGESYGRTAVQYCTSIGVVPGCSIWLDMEGVKPEVPKSDVIDYCNRWYDQVEAGGYTPGIYVGWHCGLNARDLYYRLRFQSYWSAYNLNKDEEPAIRGTMMQQKLARREERTAVGFDGFNVDLISSDNLGNSPFADVGEMWVPQ